MADARIGYGTIYEIWDASLTTPAFVEIAEVIEITPGEATSDRIEATHMQSPGRRREYITGLIDSGEATLQINWVPGSDTDVLLRDLFTSGDVVQHRITFAGDAPRTTLTYDGSITGFSKALPIDDRMTATITVAVSGAETWGTAA
jgi:predicted secreted protein